MVWGELKNTAAERRLFQRRAMVMLVFVLVLMTGLLARMYQLQIVEHEIYTTLSDKNRVQVQSVPPPRGLVYDRNNVLLAENRPVFSLTVVPERVGDMDATLARLSDILSIADEDLERFQRRLREPRRPFQAIPLSYDLDEAEIARMAVHRHQFPGVEVEAELVRYYPHSELTAHALGFVGRINRDELQRIDPVNYAGTNYIGKSGIERFYEEALHGQVGYQHVETNARGRILRVLERVNPVPGEDLQLHLDLRLQRRAHELMEGRRGAIIAIEPKTGGILALASVPGFDANKFVTGISVNDYRELSQSIDKPLFNRALRGQYPPASTIKPMMAVAALDSGATDKDRRIWDPGYFQLREGGRRFRNWNRSGDGWVDLKYSMARSNDVYFYAVGVDMGVDVMSSYLARFGFGEDATLDVSGALTGLLPTADWKRAVRNEPWYPGDSVNMSIGQGFLLATPMQLATATALIANRGAWVEPRLLKDVHGDSPVEEFLPEQTHEQLELKDPDDWEYVVDTMEEVMHGARGTGRSAGRGASYRMAGKTGTAQVFSLGQDEEYDEEQIRERLRDHALFVGFAPADDPKIAVAVIVENGGSGSGAAAPVARALFDAWLEEFPAEQAEPVISDSSAAGGDN
ncbi:MULTISPECIES: penicillin-binding protein 2 [Marinobacter]|jgi:penicillin-binding protein 2|uniref:Peptidoglycan D,D-transpeptidase MrdA n=1 Tax=Marinobacter nauticus TaxID=2743 RepID=A0A368UYW6_MARNT|nr:MULTISPECIES: penicillin-binding protein 2 [Marinobacter]ERS84949.1 penicillin-binding protein 2 [Marinobacter sp. EVN1]MBW3198455.1 penicillin-binding protein 2 [Marinobacter nauticus]MBY6183865.1 penicillin-binding protein 2 [Marinobacter nauticus]RBP73213.1 peptidoglycan glycosyltransferase [Marinobacter nauticus]RCW34032.1 peptidoglycan glycosyltransferase [Marinobacter nauticus]